MTINGVSGAKSTLRKSSVVKHTADEVMQALTAYIKEWRELENQFYQISDWRWFKQMANIRKREQLTRVYVARMRHWGVLND